jgi:Protein of unknown function (DUF2690)
MIRRVVHLVGALTLALGIGVAGSVVSATVAHAATCPPAGYQCDHQDPAVTHCADDGSFVARAPVVANGVGYGTIELRWSNRCQSNWARLWLNNPNNPNQWVRYLSVTRKDPHGYDEFRYYGNGSPIYGNMMYSPGCAKAIGLILISSNPVVFAGGEALQPGCPYFS